MAAFLSSGSSTCRGHLGTHGIFRSITPTQEMHIVATNHVMQHTIMIVAHNAGLWNIGAEAQVAYFCRLVLFVLQEHIRALEVAMYNLQAR